MKARRHIGVLSSACSRLIYILYIFLFSFGSNKQKALARLAPELSIGITTGSAVGKSLRQIDPVVQWKSSGQFGSCFIEGGLETILRMKRNMPIYNLWGRIKKNNISAKLQIPDIRNRSCADIDVLCNGDTTSLEVKGRIARPEETALTAIRLEKLIDIGDNSGMIILKPRYYVKQKFADITVQYGDDPRLFQSTGIDILQVDLNTNRDKKLTVASRKFGDDQKSRLIGCIIEKHKAWNWVAGYQRDLDNDLGIVTATYTPKDSTNVEWEYGPWGINVKAPMEGYLKFTKEVKLSIKRTTTL